MSLDKMEKRRITFDLTIGSYWEDPDHVPDSISDVKFPQGGEWESVTVDFETDGIAPFDDAVVALRKHLGRDDFHIWYWGWWLS